MATALLVLGMHRSGTSALAGALARLGVQLGDRLIDAAPDNPTGYWENAEAVAINERLLHALGSSWEDVRELPEAWRDGEAAARAAGEIDALLGEFEGVPLWALKDPRFSRTLPLWLDALKRRGIEAKALVIVRAPGEVAASLAARDGIGAAHAEMLWLRTYADIEAGTRVLPRALLRYPELLAAPEAELARAATELGLAWPNPEASLRDFVEPSRRHHAGKPGARAEGSAAEEMFEQLDGGAAWKNLAGAAKKLVAPLREASSWFDGFVPALARSREAKAEALRRFAQADAALAIADRLSHERMDELAAQGAQLARTQVALASAEAASLQRLEQLGTLDAQLARTQAALAEAERMATQRTAEAGALAEGLAQAQLSASARLAELDVLGTRLADTQAALAQAEALLARKSEEARSLDERLASSHSALAGAEATAKRQLSELHTLSAQLADTQAALASAQALCGERLGQMEQLDQRVAALAAALAEAESIVAGRTAERDAQATARAQVESILAERTAERDALTAALAKAEAFVAERTAERDAVTAERDALAARLAQPWWRRR